MSEIKPDECHADRDGYCEWPKCPQSNLPHGVVDPCPLKWLDDTDPRLPERRVLKDRRSRSSIDAVEPQRIDQTVTGEKGNCFSACLAMMLGLPISEVPNFCESPGFDEDPGPAFMKAAHEWLATRGWGHLTVDAPGMVFRRYHSRGYVMAAGMTSRGFLHSVIYKNGELWHDPHPSHEGIQEVQEVDLLFPLNPFSVQTNSRAGKS